MRKKRYIVEIRYNKWDKWAKENQFDILKEAKAFIKEWRACDKAVKIRGVYYRIVESITSRKIIG